MMPRVITAPPPNFAEIVKVFPYAAKPGILFAYGNCIYQPGGDGLLSQALIKHEAVHCERQALRPSPEIWWRDYLADLDFRLEEEVLAHRAEYRHFRVYSNARKAEALRQIAHKLCGPLYNNMVTHDCAKRLIQGMEEL